jgi:hypothetical protein
MRTRRLILSRCFSVLRPANDVVGRRAVVSLNLKHGPQYLRGQDVIDEALHRVGRHSLMWRVDNVS